MLITDFFNSVVKKCLPGTWFAGCPCWSLLRPPGPRSSACPPWSAGWTDPWSWPALSPAHRHQYPAPSLPRPGPAWKVVLLNQTIIIICFKLKRMLKQILKTKTESETMLRIRDVYPEWELLHLGSRVKRTPDLHQKKFQSIFIPKYGF